MMKIRICGSKILIVSICYGSKYAFVVANGSYYHFFECTLKDILTEAFLHEHRKRDEQHQDLFLFGRPWGFESYDVSSFRVPYIGGTL